MLNSHILLVQDQKAHLVISKVLNLARYYVSCLVLSFVFLVCGLLDLRLKWIGTDL